MGDRRAPETGVIKIPFKDAVIYIIIAVILIISLSANIILATRYAQLNKSYNEIIGWDRYDGTYIDDNEELDTGIDDDIDIDTTEDIDIDEE